jgi:tetratricopeptide (TPR) repeat protein
MCYRLLDTTRAYALEMSATDRELSELAVRHATYYRRWLEQVATEGSDLSSGAERGPTLAALNNVRAALEWCFGNDGDIEVGTGLAAAAAPVFLAMSLLPECRLWSERALASLSPAARDGADEMQLQGALGMSMMFMSGGSETARLALDRSLEIAEAHNDAVNQLRLLSRLHMFHTRLGDFKTALGYAQRGVSVVGTIEEPAARALAHCVLGMALRHAGDQNGARAELETALQHSAHARGIATYVGYDPAVLANVTLAIVLWLQGYPDQAVNRARRAVAEAESLDHPVTLAIALSWAAWVFLRVDDLENAEQHTERFLSLSESHSLGTYLAIGRAYKGVHAIRRGNADLGVESLRHCLSELDRARYGMLNTEFEIALAQGLLALGRVDEALSSMDETIRLAEANAALSYMPELLRIRGTVLLAARQPDIEGAAYCFQQSLDWSRRQAARSWELRTAIDLAALWMRQNRPDAARAALQPVFEQFKEGFDTADWKAAKDSLEAIT